MENSKQLQKALVFGILTVFSLGVIPGFLAQEFFGLPFRVHMIDFLAVFLAIFSKKYINALKNAFILALIYSFFMALPEAGINFVSSLYLIRVIAYFSLFYYFSDFKLKGRKVVYEGLVVGVLIVAIIGWVQYLALPDLTGMKYFNWDDHLFRMVSSFLDPGFTGLILALGIFLVLLKIKKIEWKWVLSIFLVFTLGFTYSRASYLVLLGGLLFLGTYEKSLRKIVVILSLMILLMIPALPRPGGEGVKLVRTSSVLSRVDNYQLGVKIIKSNPLFGVGFNNICSVKKREYAINDEVNSCSGLDNSIIFIWATSGVVGLITFGMMVNQLWRYEKILGRVSIISVVIHSMFHNSMFYAWVMLWLAIVLAFELKDYKRG